MSDFPYTPQGGAAPEPGQMAHPYAAVPEGSTQELAQLILIGMQRDIESQIDWRLQQRQQGTKKGLTGIELGLILGSAGIGVPLTAIAGSAAGFAGILAIWVGLVLINVAWSLRR